MHRFAPWIMVIAMILSRTALATTLEDVEKLVEAKWQGVTAFRADMSLEMKVPLGIVEVPSTAEGTIELLIEGESRMYRIDITNHLAKSVLLRDGLTQNVLTVFDGELEYTELTVFGRKQVNKRVPDASDTKRPMGGRAVFDRLRKQGNVTLSGETEIDGKPVWIIDVTGNGEPVDVQGPIDPDRIRVFIAQDTGLQVRVVMYDEKDREMLRMRYSNVELNPKLNAERFRYSPPPGVTVKEGKPALY